MSRGDDTIVYELMRKCVVFESTADNCDNNPAMSLDMMNKFYSYTKLEHNDKHVIAVVAPILSSLVADVNPCLTTYLCEPYRCILDASNRLEREGLPDMILIDPAFICTRLPYKGAFDLSLQYGKLTHWGVRSSVSVAVMGTKAGVYSETIAKLCSFMYKLSKNSNDHDLFPRVLRGLLFDTNEFHLLKFESGECVEYIKSGWTTPGSEQLLKAFLSVKDPWSVALHLLCEQLQVKIQRCTTQELAVPSQDATNYATSVYTPELKFLPCLGSGRYGRALLVTRASDGTSAVLKLVIGRGVRKLSREFNMICRAYKTCPNQVAQPLVPPGCITNMFMHTCEVNVHKTEQVEVAYGGYLLADVGSPVLTNIEGISHALRALLQLHLSHILHGDARIQNCIVTTDTLGNTIYKWIDFRYISLLTSTTTTTTTTTNAGSNTDFSTGLIHDLNIFFNSLGSPYSFDPYQIRAIEAYSVNVCEKAMMKVVRAFTDEL